MKTNFDLKNKSVEFFFKNKCVIITYWGSLKFRKVVINNTEPINK
jgi:hypothetical protein